jgi:hypothetical protein
MNGGMTGGDCPTMEPDDGDECNNDTDADGCEYGMITCNCGFNDEWNCNMTGMGGRNQGGRGGMNAGGMGGMSGGMAGSGTAGGGRGGRFGM